MHRRSAILCLAFILAGCGGGGDAPEAPIPFGWWGGADTSGSLSVSAESEYPRALAKGQKVIVIAWTVIWDGNGALAPSWRESLRSLIAATPLAAGYYLMDEPGLLGIDAATLDMVAAELPSKIVMMSLSRPEVDNGQHVPPQVNLLGVNLYSSHGQTPASAVVYLDKLRAYGRPMYLNLDAVRFPAPAAGCSAITPAEQQKSLAMNDAMISWGHGKDVRAYVAFLWPSALDSPERLCGAQDLPLIRTYMAHLAEPTP